MNTSGHWLGFPPPEFLFRTKQYKAVVINPPEFNPGSWCGAGKALFDRELNKYLITSRPRSAKDNKRGFAAEIYVSNDGINDFKLQGSISKEELITLSGVKIKSIEGTQLLRDPTTNRWYFYISIDIGEEFVWGGLHWETILVSSENLAGPWKNEGIVLKNGMDFDANQARDASIDIIDGQYICLYKGKDKDSNRRPMLAISNDGIHFEKLGKLNIDGKDELAFLSGSLYPTSTGILFMGTEMIEQIDPRIPFADADKHKVRHGSSMVNFCAYKLDIPNMNLKSIVRKPWEKSSPIEHPNHPVLGYATWLMDPKNNRILFYVEALDAEHTNMAGLNETVERVLVYEMNF